VKLPFSEIGIPVIDTPVAVHIPHARLHWATPARLWLEIVYASRTEPLDTHHFNSFIIQPQAF
jgi:hypothetical protein